MKSAKKSASKYLDIPFTVVSQKDATSDCVIEGYANTKTKDRVGDVVLPSAFEKSLPTYLENPVLLENHDWSKVAGVTKTAKVDDNGLFIRAKISNTRADLKEQIQEGCLRMFSIGYNELQSDFDEETKTKIVKELELLEISIVSVPANPEAKFQVVSGNEPREAPKEADSATSASRAEEGDKAGGGADDPDKNKPSRAGEDAAASAKPGAEKVFEQLIADGYERDQAIAIAFSMCDESKTAKATRGKLLKFIDAVKNALETDELDDLTVLACCEYVNDNKDEEIMTRKELIEALRKKKAASDASAAAPAAAAAGKKDEGADSSKPAAGSPAADEAPKPDGDKPAEGDIAAALKELSGKMDQIAEALAKLLEDEAAEDKDKPADEEDKGDKDKPADGEGAEDAEKSAQEVEAEIALIEAELAKLEA